jgi:alpha-2-macroglobulin-like protein
MIDLPEIKQKGVSFSSLQEVIEGEEAKFQLSSIRKGIYQVTAYKKDIPIGSEKIEISQSNSTQKGVVKLYTGTVSEGVLRFTVTDEENVSIAERLIFKRSNEEINLKINSDYKSYCPGDTVKITISASDMKGNPVSVPVFVTCTDETVLEMVEKRKQTPRIPTMVFLESEVDHLEDAHIYLSDQSNANVSIDLLLGTQGWRRFVFDDLLNKLNGENKEKFERIPGKHKGIELKKYRKNRKSDMKIVPKSMSEQFESKILIKAPMHNVENKPLLKESEEFDSNKVPKGNFEIKSRSPYKQTKEFKVETAEQLSLEMKESEPMEKNELSVEEEVEEDEEIEKEVFKKEKFKKKSPFVKKPKIPIKPKDPKPKQPKQPKMPKIKEDTRQYAFKVNKSRVQGERINFTETLYWSTKLTNKDGELTFSFDLSDSITSFNIFADCITKEGIFGSSSKLIQSKEPFYIEPKMPLEVTFGDLIQLPLALINSSTENLDVKLKCSTKGHGLTIKQENQEKVLKLSENERKRSIFDINVGYGNRNVQVKFDADAGPFHDSVTRETKITPNGFPFSNYNSGLIDGIDGYVLGASIPKDIVPNSLRGRLRFYPSPNAHLTSSLNGLLKTPHGKKIFTFIFEVVLNKYLQLIILLFWDINT